MRVESLSYRRGRRLVLRDVSFCIASGEFVGLHDDDCLAARAFAYIVMGWSFPLSGAVYLEDRPLKIPEDRKRIALVSHFVEEPVFGNASDYLYGVALTAGVPRRDAGERIANLEEAFSLARLKPPRNHPLCELDLFRVRLARVLLFQPSLLMIDGRHDGLNPDALESALTTLRRLPVPHLSVVVLNPFASITSIDRTLQIRESRLVADSGTRRPTEKVLAVECGFLPEGVRTFLARMKIRAHTAGDGFRFVAPDRLAQECIRRLAAEGAHIRAVSPAILPMPSPEVSPAEDEP